MYTIIYLYSSFIYIGASLYSSSFLSFFHPFLHLHKERWKRKLVDYLKNNWKGWKYMYIQEIVCIWVMHKWIFKGLILEMRGQRSFFVCNHWGYFCCLKWEMSRKIDIEEEWEKCPFVELLPQVWIFNL